MSAISVVMGLLLLAYLESFVFGGKGALATSSNVGWMALGFVLGPFALNVVGESLVVAVTPITTIAAGWVAFAIGARVFGARERPVPGAIRVVLTGLGTSLVVAALAFAFAWAAFPTLSSSFAPKDRHVFALLVAALASGADREGALSGRPPQSFKRLSLLARGAVLVPVALAFGASLAEDRSPLRALPVPHAVAIGGAVVLGPLLGGLGAVLLGESPGPRELWGTLLGISALAVGLSDRFGVSVVAVLFALGATLARVTRHREELLRAVAPTERALLLPLLVVIGVRIDVAQGLVLGAIAAGLGALRVAAHAGLLSGLWGPKTRYLSGISALSTTPLVVLVAAAAAPVSSDGPRDVLLPCAFVLAVLGEVVSPLALRAVHKLEPRLATPEPDDEVPS
jgi:hypothetical protein